MPISEHSLYVTKISQIIKKALMVLLFLETYPYKQHNCTQSPLKKYPLTKFWCLHYSSFSTWKIWISVVSI